MTRDLADILGLGVHIDRVTRSSPVSALEVVRTPRARLDTSAPLTAAVSVRANRYRCSRSKRASPVRPDSPRAPATAVYEAGATHHLRLRCGTVDRIRRSLFGFILGRHDARGKHEEQSEETAADGHDFWYQPPRRRQFQERAKRLRARAVHTVGLGARAKWRSNSIESCRKRISSTVVTVRIDRFPSTVQSTQHRAPPSSGPVLCTTKGSCAAVGPHTHGAGHPWLPPITALSGSQVVPHVESG